MMTDILLEAQSLRKEYGSLIAVADVSLQIERGSTHAIIGPNGAGKTTLFNLLSGKYPPTRGHVLFRGVDITRLPAYRRARLGIGRSFQITNIFPNLSIFENVRLAAQMRSGVNFRAWRRADSFTAINRRAADMLDLVGLGGVADQLASVLPHGDKRKLELAILLAGDAELLLLDEPTAGMASEGVPELVRTIAAVRQQGNKTIVLVEHNMDVVMGISDRITVMHQGSVLAAGTPAEISADKTVQSVYLGELYNETD